MRRVCLEVRPRPSGYGVTAFIWLAWTWCPSTCSLTIDRSGHHSPRSHERWLAMSEGALVWSEVRLRPAGFGGQPSLACQPKLAPSDDQASEGWCGRGDSNPHTLASASPSNWRNG